MRVIWFAATLATAGPEVHWNAPSACPDADVAASTIAAGLDPGSELAISSTVRELPDGFEADVEIRSAAGETRRSLHSPQCETLLDAVVLIAQAAQSEAEAGAAETVEPAAQSDAPAVVEPEDDAATIVQPESPPRSVAEPPPEPVDAPSGREAPEISPYLRLAGQVGWGITPVVDGGGGGAFGLQWRRLRVEAFAAVAAPTTKRIDAAPDVRTEIWAWSVGARGCGTVWATRTERVALPLCGGLEAGEMVGAASGPGLQTSSTHRDAWLAIHAGPAVLVRLIPWLSLYGELDGFALLRRPGFRIDGAGIVHRPAPAGVRFSLGIEVHARRPGPGKKSRRIGHRAGMGWVWGAP